MSLHSARHRHKREIVEATLYLLRAGWAWRMLPHNFPSWQTVYHYLRRWEREGIWVGVLHTLVMADRESASRETSPSVASIVSQTVRTSDQRGFKGYDAGMSIHGRKCVRHLSDPWRSMPHPDRYRCPLLAVEVHGADVQQRGGARGVQKRSRRRFPFVERVSADGGYAGKLFSWAKDKTQIVLEIVRRMPWTKGFVVIRQGWVVERTFAWIMK